MNSRAGSGEYSSTSTSPSRPASASMAAASASGVADVGGGAGRGDALALELRGEVVELGLGAGDEPDAEALAAEAAGDGEAEIRPGADDHDRHARQASRDGASLGSRRVGKRVSWVELYLDLVFVLAVGRLAHLIVADPEMHSVWVALGLFVTLWWTWVGFAVLYNRHGADSHALRLLILAGSVPVGVAAVAIDPASTGDSTVFALSPRRHAGGAGDRDRGRRRRHRPAARPDHARLPGLGGAVPDLDLGAGAVPLRAVGDRHRPGVGGDAGRGPRGRAPGPARPRPQGAHPDRPGGGAGRASTSAAGAASASAAHSRRCPSPSSTTRVAGDESAPALLLGGSLGTAMAMWEPQVAPLAERLRVIRYDHRGHGASPVPAGPYDIADLGRDVLALMDRLGLERASFGGVSLGGMVAMWLGANAPERVDRLVLCFTSAHLPPASGWADRAAAVREAGTTEVVADAVVARWLTPGFAAEHPETQAWLRAMLLASDPEGYAASCGVIERLDLRDALPSITAPTLVDQRGGRPVDAARAPAAARRRDPLSPARDAQPRRPHRQRGAGGRGHPPDPRARRSLALAGRPVQRVA